MVRLFHPSMKHKRKKKRKKRIKKTRKKNIGSKHKVEVQNEEIYP